MQPQNIGYYILNEAADPEIIDAKVLSQNKLGNRVIAEGTLQRTGTKNRNGRTYLKADLEPYRIDYSNKSDKIDIFAITGD